MCSRWRRVSEVFALGLDLDPADRPAFVVGVADDADIAREVLRLLRLNDEAGDFLETPAVRLEALADPVPILSPGDVVAERFEIVVSIGRGGMGDVYEARDRVLGESVALKIMRPGPGDTEAVAERFRQEVQLARRISHPGVCRVHDVAFHLPDGGPRLVVVTMELLRGETLAVRVRRGRLSPEEVLEVGDQLAEALDAAHEQRVLHRDIKPENIFLVPRKEGIRAVLTDFGLAGVIGPDAEDAEAGTPLRFGTPHYMAPELLAGAQPSVKSDLYAFGLVLYEMLAGYRPPPTPTECPIAAGPAPRLVFDAADIPPGWKDALARAVDPNPQRRFDSARAIISTLSPRAETPAPSARRGRARAAFAAIAILTVALIAGWFRFYQQDRPAVTPSSRVLVTRAVNMTGNAELEGATEVLRSQLAQSPHFETVAADRIHGRLRQMRRDPTEPLTPELAREVALREGISLVVYPSLTTVDSRYQVAITLERVGSRPTFARSRWTRAFAAPDKDGLFDAFHDAAVWIRTMSGESAEELADQDRSPLDTTTASWEALRLFTRAEARHTSGQLGESTVLLRQALQADPEFAAAYMRLADVLMSLKQEREGYEAWREAIRLSSSQQLTARESLRITGLYHEDAGDLAAAERAYREYALHYPHDFNAMFYLGSILADRGKTEEAIPWLARAADLEPGSAAARVHLANAHLEVGRSDGLAADVEALDRHGHSEWAVWLRSLEIFASGDVRTALQRLDGLRTSEEADWKSRATTLTAAWLAEIGQDERALQELTRGIQFDQARGLGNRAAVKWLHVGELRRRRGDIDGAADAAARAVAASPDARTLMLAGTILARADRPAEARALLESLRQQPDVPRVMAARDRLIGELELQAGRVEAALARLRAAAAAGRFQEDRRFLAHWLMRTGHNEEAIRLLADLVNHPARFYSRPEPELPGAWAGAVGTYATALRTAGQAIPGGSQRFSQLRVRVPDIR